MFLLRVVTEYLLAFGFRLLTVATLMQGLSALLAIGVSFAIAGGRETPAWLTFALVRCGVVSVILAAGGIALAAIQARAAKPGALTAGVNEPLPREWVLPAMVPTLLLPALAATLSRDLVLLWKDAVILLDRLGLRDEFARGGNFAGLAFMPIFAALIVPALEAAAGLLLVAVPPLLLALLAARSPRLRVSCQLLVVAQATFVAASIFGADVFGKLVERLAPLLRSEGGAEVAMVLASLTRARDVLMSTVTGYAAVLAAYGLSLWALMALHAPPRPELEAGEEPAPAPREPADWEPVMPAAPDRPHPADPQRPAVPQRPVDPRPVRGGVQAAAPPARSYDRVSELPQSSRQALDQVIARYRADRGREAGDSIPARSGDEFAPAPEPLPAPSAPSSYPDRWPSAWRKPLRIALIGWGAVMLCFGAIRLVQPLAARLSINPAATRPGLEQAAPAGEPSRARRPSRRDRATLLGGVILLGLAALMREKQARS